MANDPIKTSEGDRDRVNVHQKHEVAYWTKKRGVTRKQLEAAVENAHRCR